MKNKITELEKKVTVGNVVAVETNMAVYFENVYEGVTT